MIWGLDLKEMQWGKFKSSYMFGNRDYYLRRTKFVVYQCAMIFCVVSESVGTAALSDYVKEQSLIQKLHSSARVHNDSFVGIASYNIFVGIYVATIFGGGFFFDLFWPERYEPANIRLAWRICAVLACVMALADALALTVIVASYKATITAKTADQIAIAKSAVNPPLVYRHNGRAIASVVCIWPGWIATVASTYILFKAYAHNEKYGPKSDHALQRESDEKAANAKLDAQSSQTETPTVDVQTPSRSVVHSPVRSEVAAPTFSPTRSASRGNRLQSPRAASHRSELQSPTRSIGSGLV